MKRQSLVFLIFIVSFVIFILMFYLNSQLVLEREEIPAILNVGNKAGIDTNTTALTFGIITKGSTSSRNLLIENNYDFPIKVEFEVEGEIKRFLLFEKNVYFDKGESKTISIGTIDPGEEEYGNYSGVFIVTTKKDLWG